MLSISIKHPDAEQFIDAKLVKGKVTGANVSVKIDNEFMDAGAFTVIQKPFPSPQDVLKAVETAHYLRTSGNEA